MPTYDGQFYTNYFVKAFVKSEKMEEHMTQQTFPITGRKPRVVITRVNGNLTVQPWEREEIGVNTSGTAEVVRQEGDTLTIIDCQGDLELWIPDNRNRMFRISTNITATDVSRNA